MKTRRTKFLLSLLAMGILGFSMVSAYTFEVANRNPFGVLNLSRLIIKDLTHTGIILDSANNTIKVTKDNAGNGQIRVYEICNEDGTVCKTIGSLGNGGGTYHAGNGIEIDNNNYISSTITDTNTWDANTNGTAGYVAAPGTNKVGYVRKVGTDGEPSWQVDATGNGGGFTAIGGEEFKNYICVRNSENELNCKTIKLGDINTTNFVNGKHCIYTGGQIICNAAGEGNGDIIGDNGKRCSYVCDEREDEEHTKCKGGHVECFENKPSDGTRQLNTSTQAGYVATGGSEFKGYVRKIDDDGEPGWAPDATSNGGGSSDATGAHTKRCRYICKAVIIDGEVWEINTQTWPEISLLLSENKNGGTHTIQRDACSIVCDQNAPSVPTVSINGTQGYLCSKVDGDSLDCSTDPNDLGGSITINGGDSFRKTGTYANTTMTTLITARPLYFTTSFYHYDSFNFYTKQNDQYGAATRVTFDAKGIRLGNGQQFFSGAGLSVAGSIVAGNASTDQYIRINATGNYSSEDKHYQILGSPELLVGTTNGAFMYFRNYENLSSNNVTKYRVGINNEDPQATLDVAGNIRIQDNPCAPSTCSESNAGAITFHNNKFYGCKKIYGSTEYRWHEFDMTDTNSNAQLYDVQCVQLSY